jgi:hypothetical protein
MRKYIGTRTTSQNRKKRKRSSDTNTPRHPVDLGPHDGDREEHAGEHYEEEGDPVDAELPRDAPRVDPAVLGDHLVAGLRPVELDQHRHRQRRRRQRGEEADGLEQALPRPGQQGGDQRPDGGHDHEGGEVREHSPAQPPARTTTYPSTSTAPDATARA